MEGEGKEKLNIRKKLAISMLIILSLMLGLTGCNTAALQ